MSKNKERPEGTVESLVNCVCCSREYSQENPPITLPCGHNLCRECATKHHRRNKMIKCPVDNLDKKVPSLSANVDFLDFIEVLKKENIHIPQKRKRVCAASIQCDTLLPEQNYVEQLKALEEKKTRLEQYAKYSYFQYFHMVYSLMQNSAFSNWYPQT